MNKRGNPKSLVPSHPGNLNAAKEGVHSPRLIQARAAEIAGELTQSFQFSPAEMLSSGLACVAINPQRRMRPPLPERRVQRWVGRVEVEAVEPQRGPLIQSTGAYWSGAEGWGLDQDRTRQRRARQIAERELRASRLRL